MELGLIGVHAFTEPTAENPNSELLKFLVAAAVHLGTGSTQMEPVTRELLLLRKLPTAAVELNQADRVLDLDRAEPGTPVETREALLQMAPSNRTQPVVVPVPAAMDKMTAEGLLPETVGQAWLPEFAATLNTLPVVVVVVPTVGGTTRLVRITPQVLLVWAASAVAVPVQLCLTTGLGQQQVMASRTPEAVVVVPADMVTQVHSVVMAVLES